MPYKTIDLCAGIGGIRRGFELAGGFENVISAEIDEFACKTYEHLFHEDPRNDVATDEFKRKVAELHYDVLLAGFPCQAFSSVGRKQGFEDTTRGTIFFEIAQIIKETIPKVVFLENVENLIIHDKGNTFKTIIRTLDEELDYEIIGFPHGESENLKRYARSFVRNSKDFGVPQNRPRVYIIAFSRQYFGRYLSMLPAALPLERSRETIFGSLNDILEESVPARFFLSSGYLKTLEDHRERQKQHGYGFGYRIINDGSIEHPIANTLLATGGSGRERNLIYDPVNGEKYAGTEVTGKYSPINSKCIRTMTPTEWGRLQGFVGYGFMNKDGIDEFSFPEQIPVTQQFKQLGNSVTIPVIEEMALFIKRCLIDMTTAFSKTEARLFSMYCGEFKVCRRIADALGNTLRTETLNKFFDAVYHFGYNAPFRTCELADYLKCTSARSSQILKQLSESGCVRKVTDRHYIFMI
ncbi:MAG: DNA (cytosine-5-)-methyltransferase [Acutalibacteraceae bacterium]|jgi:DNA (cytosine-5)-methyltransferase 1